MNWTPPPIPVSSALYCAACHNTPPPNVKCGACGLTGPEPISTAPTLEVIDYAAIARAKVLELYSQGQLRQDEIGMDARTFMGLPPPMGYQTWYDYAKAAMTPPPAPGSTKPAFYEDACVQAIQHYRAGKLMSQITHGQPQTFMGLPPPIGYVTWIDYAQSRVTPPAPRLAPPPPQPVPPNLVPIAAPPKKINVRQKGQRGEREVVKFMQSLVDIATTKYGLDPVFLQRNALQAHTGGCDLHGLEGFAIEVKFQEIDWNPAWWKQAVQQAQDLCVRGKQVVPILFWRKSNVKWMVMARLWVQTPFERDQVQLDVSMSLDQFERWFSSAIDEAMEKEAAKL